MKFGGHKFLYVSKKHIRKQQRLKENPNNKKKSIAKKNSDALNSIKEGIKGKKKVIISY